MPLYLPVPGPLVAASRCSRPRVAAGLYAALAAWGETRFGIPMLISSLLLSYPAIGIASYLVALSRCATRRPACRRPR